MALVDASDADKEAHRILGASTRFEVLQLEPQLATAVLAKEHHAARRAILITRRSIGQPHVTRAAAALDDVVALLGDAALLQREREAAAAARRTRVDAARELDGVHRRTGELEERAKAIIAAQEKEKEKAAPPAAETATS